jgi:hypothetical protein
MNNKLKIAAAIIAVALLTVGIVYALYTMTSNPVTGTANDQETLSLTLSPTTIVVGETWTLTATVSDGTVGLTVTFIEQGVGSVGTADTNSLGVATLTLTPGVGSHTYTATAEHP